MIYALLTNQGTAASETALCSEHEKDEACRFAAFGAAQPVGDGPDDFAEDVYFVDCTGNDQLACIVCGYSEKARLPLSRGGETRRLEELRVELRAERISYSELLELQGLSDFIDPSDVELLEAAGVPEHPEG